MKQCDVCEKEVELSDGTSIIGVTVKFYNLSELNKYEEFARKQMGVYGIDHEYNMCFECFLRALGIPPKS